MFMSPGSRARIRPHTFGQQALPYGNNYPTPPMGGRLSLTSSDPTPGSDVTGATTVYLVPYQSDWGTWWNGESWQAYKFGGQLSLTLTTSLLASSTNYDVYATILNGQPFVGTAPAWTSASVRSTAADVEFFQGVYVNATTFGIINSVRNINSPARSARLLGTIRTVASGVTDDSSQKRLLSDANYPLVRTLQRIDQTNSWAYTGNSSWRQANNSTQNQVEWVHCVSGRPVNLEAYGFATSTGVAPVVYQSGIGIDTVTANSASIYKALLASATTTDFFTPSYYSGYPGLGYHSGAWLENASSAVVGYGDNGATFLQTGIRGWTVS